MFTDYESRVQAALDILLATDAYKLDHRRQYPAGTEYVYANMTARGSRIDGVDRTVFFGLQAVLDDLHTKWEHFFLGVNGGELDEVLLRYEEFVGNLLGENQVGTGHFRELHALGHLPLEIRALPEGTLTPLRVPYLTVVNTDPRFFWLTNYLETVLSAALWQPITSATTAWRARALLDERAERAGEPEATPFQGHDFSYRGMAGTEAAAASGAGHMLSFTGTDTLPSILYAERHYAGRDNGLLGASVAATEHSVMMADGQDGEFGTFSRLLDLYPTGILSVVSDTWNLWEVLTDFLPRLREKIVARDGKLVIRPDSGDPVKILCGDPDVEPGDPYFAARSRGVIGLLADTFGTTVNDKGYLVLDPHVGAIYGDSITYDRADAITANLIAQGFSPSIPVFGFGSFGYQYVTRDTFQMAMKTTWTQVSGEERNIIKNPITDNGTKKSATGLLSVRRQMDGTLYLVEKATPEQLAGSELRPVYRNGEFLIRQSFAQVRERLARDSALYRREAVAQR